MSKKVRLISIAATVIVLGICVLFMWRTGFFEVRSIEDVRAYFAHFEKSTMLIFFLIQLMSVILAPIPSNITAAAGALMIGTLPAFLLSFAAISLGSVLVFLMARTLGREQAMKLISKKVSNRYIDIINAKWDTFLILTFLFPFFPDDIICILAGLTPMPLKRFAVIMLMTRPWGVLASCIFGGVALDVPVWCSAIFVALCILLFLAGLKYGDRLENAAVEWFRRHWGKRDHIREAERNKNQNGAG